MNAHTSRRDMLRAMGALVVSAATPLQAFAFQSADVARDRARPGKSNNPAELDTWIAVTPDGAVTAFFGKPDMGLGLEVAIAQIVAEEMDLPVDRVSVVLADTALTPNQGGASGSTGVQRGGVTLRYAAAEARRLLVLRAADDLKVPAEGLTVTDGMIRAPDGRSRSYGELIRGAFDAKLDWNGQYGNGLTAKGKAEPKDPKDYKVVGTSPDRRDIAQKVFGQYAYSADHRVPGMLHGRSIRPPVAGAKVVSVDESSIAGIKGARVVRKMDFLGVVAPREWDAVKAARLLKVTWSDATPPFVGSDKLYDHIRQAPVAAGKMTTDTGDVEKALKAEGVRLVEAQYEWPVQSHSSMGPGCAVADVRADSVTLWTPSQKTHFAAEGVAKLLGRPVASVRSIYIQGPGAYGRNDAGDACADAALMSLLAGAPVRVQGSRADGHGWDPKGAASIHTVRGALGPDGKLVAYDFQSKGLPRIDVGTAEATPQDLLAGLQTGFSGQVQAAFDAPEDAYVVPNRRAGWQIIARMLEGPSPLRTSHLRDPLGPQIHFASESFIDECALAAGADPVAFRLAHITDQRHRAVIQAGAKAANWKPGPPGARRRASGSTMIGTGMAHVARGATLITAIAEVEVDRATGRVWPRRFWIVHECGLIINPENLKRVIEGNVVHGASRALFEETTFDTKNVTSVDWARYPILEMGDAPESIDIVLLNRPDLPPSGAGEPSTRPVAGAIANAIFDATGARLRRAPFTRARMKAALQAV